MGRTNTKTPLRYPGGKSQLAEFVENTLKMNNISGTYIEPFAGGAGIAFQLLLDDKIDRIVINDFDASIYSVWYNILNNAETLVELIEKVPFDYITRDKENPELLINFWDDIKRKHEQVKHLPESIDNAFTTLMLNRMNISGIISGGPIGGRSQKGKYNIAARFNKKTLKSKIESIAKRRTDIDLFNLDALDFISMVKKEPKYSADNSFVFFDPPYYVQGKNLYLSFINRDNHEKLADKILDMDDYYWITTYDYAEPIGEMYRTANQKYAYSISYTANKRGQFKEFLFASSVTKLVFSENMNVKTL